MKVSLVDYLKSQLIRLHRWSWTDQSCFFINCSDIFVTCNLMLHQGTHHRWDFLQGISLYYQEIINSIDNWTRTCFRQGPVNFEGLYFVEFVGWKILKILYKDYVWQRYLVHIPIWKTCTADCVAVWKKCSRSS